MIKILKKYFARINEFFSRKISQPNILENFKKSGLTLDEYIFQKGLNTVMARELRHQLGIFPKPRKRVI